MRLAAALFASLATSALALEHRDASLGFTFAMPEGWRAIAAGSLAERSRGAAPFAAGYQLDVPRDFDFPYLIVQLHAVRGGSVDDFAATLAREVGALPAGATMTPPSIDRARNLVTTTLDMVDMDRGAVRCFMFVLPGKSGAVQLNCYTTPDEAEAARAEFETIVSSLRWDPGQGYSPRPGFGRSVLRGALIGAAVGAAVWLVRKLTGKA